MSDPIRLCCECAHFLGEGDGASCARTKVQMPDLIYGKHSDHYNPCVHERGSFVGCGVAGRNWEPRK